MLLHVTGLPFLSFGHGTLALHVGVQIVIASMLKSRHVRPPVQSELAVVSIHES